MGICIYASLPCFLRNFQFLSDYQRALDKLNKSAGNCKNIKIYRITKLCVSFYTKQRRIFTAQFNPRKRYLYARNFCSYGCYFAHFSRSAYAAEKLKAERIFSNIILYAGSSFICRCSFHLDDYV